MKARWMRLWALLFGLCCAPLNAVAREAVDFFPADAPASEQATVPDLVPTARDDVFGHIQGTDFYIGGELGGGGLVLFGAVGGLAAVANAADQVDQRSAEFNSLIHSDVRAMLRVAVLSASSTGPTQQVYYTLTPEVSFVFTDRTHFNLVCGVRAQLPSSGRRTWAFHARFGESYDSTLPESALEIASELPACVHAAHRVFSDFVRRRDQVREGRLAILGSRVVRRSYLLSADGSRVALVLPYTVTEYQSGEIEVLGE